MLDWDDLRFFLAVARHRTLAAAAKVLHVTQSTVGRRLATLEAGLGAHLLRRVTGGYALTVAGQEILTGVERMEGEATQVERMASSHGSVMTGVVRVMGSQLMTSHLLAPSLAALHAADHSVMVELVPDSAGEAVLEQEADIVIQLRPFEQQDLIVRKLGTMSFGLYAAAGYISRFGLPSFEDGCAGHLLITLLDERELPAQAAWLSEHGRRADVVLRSDSYETQHWATACGSGLAILPRFRGDLHPSLQHIPAPVPVPACEIWLAVREDNRKILRVRAVLDCIADSIRSKGVLLDPPERLEFAAAEARRGLG